MPAKNVVAVDLGGTNVRAAVFASDGSRSTGVAKEDSRAEAGERETLDAVARAVRSCVSEFRGSVSRVGLAIPGHTDDKAGVVRWSPNFGVRKHGVLHYWKDVPVRRRLQALLGTKVSLANDANAAAIGEYRFGSGAGRASCLVMLTLGTGVGGGVVLGPESVTGSAKGPLLLLGGNKGGAELGHTLVSRGGLDSSSGAYGTLEAYCQRDAIVRRTQHKLLRGRASVLSDMVGGDLGRITPEHVTRAAKLGDAVAQEVWREVGGYLGAAVGSIINVFAPDVFAIGGQIAGAGRWLFDPLRDEARCVAIPSLFADCKIVRAMRAKDAGLVGAAAVALEAT